MIFFPLLLISSFIFPAENGPHIHPSEEHRTSQMRWFNVDEDESDADEEDNKEDNSLPRIETPTVHNTLGHRRQHSSTVNPTLTNQPLPQAPLGIIHEEGPGESETDTQPDQRWALPPSERPAITQPRNSSRSASIEGLSGSINGSTDEQSNACCGCWESLRGIFR